MCGWDLACVGYISPLTDYSRTGREGESLCSHRAVHSWLASPSPSCPATLCTKPSKRHFICYQRTSSRGKRTSQSGSLETWSPLRLCSGTERVIPFSGAFACASDLQGSSGLWFSVIFLYFFIFYFLAKTTSLLSFYSQERMEPYRGQHSPLLTWRLNRLRQRAERTRAKYFMGPSPLPFP